MREIKKEEVILIIQELVHEACCKVEATTLSAIKSSEKMEASPVGKQILNEIIKNDEIACLEKRSICQDTGIVVCFVKVGRECYIPFDLTEAINDGIKLAYKEGYYRNSVVNDPLERANTLDNTPAIIHYDLVDGDRITIMLAPKGAGSENMSTLKMLTPADGVSGIKQFVIDTIKEKGAKACPPIIVGLGIGGDFEKCALLAKEALMDELDAPYERDEYQKLASELKEEINKLGIGPMGLGGSNTCLGVRIKSYPCHIASLPVAINIQCHVSRHAKGVI